jgi:Domain of unknown function (DUF4157)
MGDQTATVAPASKAPERADRQLAQRGPNPLFGLQQSLGNQATLRLLESGVIQAKLRVSQPGDSDEIEADRVAERVVSAQTAPVIQRKCACSAGAVCAKCGEEEESIHRSVAGTIHRQSPPLIQRLVDDQTPSQEVHPEDSSTPPSAARPKSSQSLIVEDEAGPAAPGQMKKSQFMQLLRLSVCATADAALAAAGRNSKSCPYIEQWLNFYSSQGADYIERALHKYAPESASAKRAQDYISIVSDRVRQAVTVWARTGRVTGVPAGAPILPGASNESAVEATLGAGSAGAKGGPSEVSVSAPAGGQRILAKSYDSGAAASAADPQAVRERLGSGQPLDASVRSRMEPAFGQDFSHVRLHTDSTAALLSTELNARAFTVGDRVGFASGEYKPGTPVGDALIAHELAHVVQQGAGNRLPDRREDSALSSDQSFEKEADFSAAGAVASLWAGMGNGVRKLGRNARPRLRGGLSLQRCGVEGLADEQRKDIWQTAITNQFGDLIAKQGNRSLPELETFVEKSREILQDSTKQGVLPKEIYQLWDIARAAIIPLVPSAKAGTNDDKNAGLRGAATAAIQAFYDKFRGLVSGLDAYSHKEMRGKFASVQIFVNPFFSSRQYLDFTDRLKKATSGSDWLSVFDDFKTVSQQLSAYVAQKLQAQSRIREMVDLPAARTRIRETIKTLGPSLKAGNAPSDKVNETADLLDDFVANLRAAVAPLDHEAHTPARKGSMGSTTYTATHFSESNAYDLRAEIREARTDAGKWDSVFRDFEGAAAAVDSYLADPARQGYSEQAEQLRFVGGPRRRSRRPSAQSSGRRQGTGPLLSRGGNQSREGHGFRAYEGRSTLLLSV